MEPSFAQLNRLVALITSAVADVKTQYTRLNVQAPDLSDVEPHPLDNMPVPDTLKAAVETIAGACTLLTTMVLPPVQALHSRTIGFIISSALRVAYECEVADVLKDYPAGLHVSKIAARSGVDAGKLSRLLRLLAAWSCFREIDQDVFVNNRLSILLLSSNPGSGITGFCLDEMYSASTMLYPTLADSVFGPSYAPQHAPFSKFYDGRTFFDFVHNVEPWRGERFNRGMMAVNQSHGMKSMIQGFPWRNLSSGTTVCDLGAGVGFTSMELARTNPGIRIVLQDVNNVVQEAKLVWREVAADIVDQGRVEFVPTDFLKESPVANCDIYYLKNIIHNWADDACQEILAKIKRVMKPTSRIVVQSVVMECLAQNRQDGPRLSTVVPDHLPAIYGEGRTRPYTMDIMMLLLTNSRERTLPEFRILGEAVGLTIAKIWDCGELSAIEYVLPCSPTS